MRLLANERDWIYGQKPQDQTPKEIKAKVPPEVQLKLNSRKVLTGQSISSQVTEALLEYYERHGTEIVEKKPERNRLVRKQVATKALRVLKIYADGEALARRDARPEGYSKDRFGSQLQYCIGKGWLESVAWGVHKITQAGQAELRKRGMEAEET